MYTSKIGTVKNLVAQRGGWSSVYSHYNGLNEAMKRGTRQGPCPYSGQGRTKFRFFKDYDETGGAYHNDVGALPDGIEVLAWYTGKDKSEVLDEIIDVCGGETVLERVRPMPKREIEFCSVEEARERAARITKYAKESKPIVGTLGEVYLRSRGIKADLRYLGNNLRFHPAMPYKEDDNSPWQRFPCMLAVYRDKFGKPLTFHRTFLRSDGFGKAEIERPKMLLAPPRDMRGGFIAFDAPVVTPDSVNMGIAEGIENALSAREGMGCPMFCGNSDRVMAMTNFPKIVNNILVFRDVEPSGAGLRAAEAVRDNNKQRVVSILKPDSLKKKVDWNDEYRDKGHAAFARYFGYIKPEYRVNTGVEIPENLS